MKGNTVRLNSTILTCLIFFLTLAYVVQPVQTIAQTDATENDGQKYTCGMHPQIISDEPGICPICNMKLTPIRNGGGKEGTVRIDATTRQNMGLVTADADYRNLDRPVYTFGEVAVPDPNVYSVTLKFDGWIERLFVNEEGEQVFVGQPLLEVYSPELVSAQKELLVALKSGSSGTMQRLAEAARSRLRNWDISDDQLESLEQTGEIKRTLIIRSPANGFVSLKNVSEGDRVGARTVLYQIVDLSDVWVTASIYEQDLPFIKVQQNAEVTIPSLPGKTFSGKLDFVSPTIDEKGQIEIRLKLNNADFELKPAMYAEVTVSSSAGGRRLAIPRSAVINSGVRQLVFVATEEDAYEPRQVVTGIVGADDFVEVVDGLQPGEQVVTSGQFLIDSETRLNEKMTMAGGHNHGSAMHMASSKTIDSSISKKVADPYDIHTCPMPSHFHVLNYGPGKCPECGMDLVPVAETENEPVYVCPMPNDSVASKEPGVCPKCNMKLVQYHPVDSAKADGMHHDHSDMNGSAMQMDTKETAKDPYDIHTCPMPSHFHVLNYGPGKCNECGMDLVPVNETDNKPIYVCPMPSCKVAAKEPGDCPVCNMHLIEYKPEAKK